MTLSDEGIIYAESCRIKEKNLSLVYEFLFEKINEKECCFACRFMNAGETPVPAKENDALFENMKLMAERLKERCEKMEGS
jgi:hypothetical protein